jgi:hypothetical protein
VDRKIVDRKFYDWKIGFWMVFHLPKLLQKTYFGSGKLFKMWTVLITSLFVHDAVLIKILGILVENKLFTQCPQPLLLRLRFYRGDGSYL